MTAVDGEPPPNLRGGMGDHITASHAVAGILAALLARERNGRGQLVDISLLRSGIYSVGWDLGLQLRFGKAAPTVLRTHNINPMVNSYRAGDDKWFWLLGVESDRMFPKLCAALERPDLLDDERFNSARNRRHNAEVLIAILDDEFARQDRDALVASFDARDVWWAPVNTGEDVLADPQAHAAGAFVDVPEGSGAPAHTAVASPVTFDGYDAGPSGPVPALGEHTDEVLREIGYSEDDLASLRAAGAIS